MAVQVSLGLMLCLCLVGCSDKPTIPLATVPFDVSRKGESVRIPISVTEENADLEFVYIVGVFLWNPDRDPRLSHLSSYPPQQRLYLRVRVWHIVDGHEVAVPVHDLDFDYDSKTQKFIAVPSMSERKTDVAYVKSSNGTDVKRMESVHFRFQEYGQYRVDVDTVADTPMLYSIPSWLTVQRDFPHGK
ncbi:MAG: hypothetical protein ACTHLF_13285 [Luteibacter sp.]